MRTGELKISSYAIVDRSDSIDSQYRREGQLGILQWVLVLGLCALLIFAVLAFGAVYDWSIFAFEAGSATLFLIWAAQQVISKELTLSHNPLYLTSFLFFGLILTQIVLRRSAYGYITKYEALQYVSFGIVALIGAECARSERARKLFALVMTVFGACYAFFALVQELTSNGKIFWFHRPQFHGSIYGTYVNHDHYAGLLEMLLPIPFVLSMGHLFRGGKRALIGACAILMAATIFLSTSRGGMLAFAFEMALFAALTLGKRRSPRIALGTASVCVLILALLIFLGKGQVLGRLGDLSPGMRLDITKDSLRMFSKRPILGWGLGTFPTV
jgi:O-antigen ligase